MSATSAVSPVRVKPIQLSPEQVKFYKEQGYVLIKSLFTPEHAQMLHTEVMDLMFEVGLGMTKLKQTGKYLRGSGLDQFVNSPNLKAVAEGLMEGPSTLYMPFTAVKSGGGGGRFHFHQDNQYTRLDGPACNIWVALSPMRKETGCLQIVPKSHLNGTLNSMLVEDGDGHKKVMFEPKDFEHIVMEPGDAVAFTRLTVHGSGVNASRDPRVAYAVQFHQNGVKARWEDGNYYDLLEKPRWPTAPVDSVAQKTVEDTRSSLDGH